MYEDYKPFRNYLRQFDMIPALKNLWNYSSYFTDENHNKRFLLKRSSLKQLLKGKVFPWELDLLSREIILNAGKSGKKLDEPQELYNCINHLRRIDNEMSKRHIAQGKNVWDDMHKGVNVQFPRQLKTGLQSLMRYYKIFSRKEVEDILVQKSGLRMRNILLLGILSSALIKKDPIMSVAHDLTALGIRNKNTEDFFELISIDIDDLKAKLREVQSYDDNWAYTWNPLVGKPLIKFPEFKTDERLCPIPDYLSDRTSGGIYYDMVKVDGFDHAYGESFEQYVGEVINKVCEEKFDLQKGEPYQDHGIKHGVDWMLNDGTANLFIECKTKRMTRNAKFHLSDTSLDSDLDILAGSIIQNYKNILDARNGKTTWKVNALKIYPLIVTMEHWILFTPTVLENLKELVEKQLCKQSLSGELLEAMPYSVASIAEFEEFMPVIAEIGIEGYLSEKNKSEFASWMHSPFTNTKFRHENQTANPFIFQSEWDELIPKIPA